MIQCRVPELMPLIAKLQAVVAEHVVKNDLPLGVSQFIQHKVTSDFSYRDDGVEAKGGLTGRHIAKKDWTYAGTIVTADVRSSVEFASAAKALARLDESSTIGETRVSNLVYTLAPKIIGGDLRTEEEILSEVDSFLDATLSTPAQCAAKVELTGMFLKNPQVQLPRVLLRQTRRDDLEKEVSIFSRGTEAVGFPYPGIIGEVSFFGSPNEIHEVVPKLVTMLRLFAVASVNYSVYWYSLGSKSTLIHYPGTHSVPPLTALIHAEDEPRLKKFWSLLDPALPHYLSERVPSGTVDYLLVAYERYCAAILRRDSFEERVANAVMGLEALFLEEKQEVAYRCRLRAARALSYLLENPQEVFERLGYAYDARNSFAHGDRLSVKRQRKLTAKFPDREVVFQSAASYLRKALVASILGPSKKASLIELLDRALVDPAHDTSTSAFFERAADVV